MELPPVKTTSNIQDAIMLQDYTKGFTIGSIVGYIRGDLEFITPGAYADYTKYLESAENFNILVKIINELDKIDKNTTIHRLHSDFINKEI